MCFKTSTWLVLRPKKKSPDCDNRAAVLECNISCRNFLESSTDTASPKNTAYIYAVCIFAGDNLVFFFKLCEWNYSSRPQNDRQAAQWGMKGSAIHDGGLCML